MKKPRSVFVLTDMHWSDEQDAYDSAVIGVYNSFVDAEAHAEASVSQDEPEDCTRYNTVVEWTVGSADALSVATMSHGRLSEDEKTRREVARLRAEADRLESERSAIHQKRVDSSRAAALIERATSPERQAGVRDAVANAAKRARAARAKRAKA